jgi:hypothetical protein
MTWPLCRRPVALDFWARCFAVLARDRQLRGNDNLDKFVNLCRQQPGPPPPPPAPAQVDGRAVITSDPHSTSLLDVILKLVVRR